MTAWRDFDLTEEAGTLVGKVPKECVVFRKGVGICQSTEEFLIIFSGTEEICILSCYWELVTSLYEYHLYSLINSLYVRKGNEIDT